MFRETVNPGWWVFMSMIFEVGHRIRLTVRARDDGVATRFRHDDSADRDLGRLTERGHDLRWPAISTSLAGSGDSRIVNGHAHASTVAGNWSPGPGPEIVQSSRSTQRPCDERTRDDR